MKNQTYLFLNKVTLEYEQKQIVENISLKIFPGKVVTILGKSGCGKSTIFKSILGLLEPKQGFITKNVNSISYMPQDNLLLPWRNVLENLLLPFELDKNNKQNNKQNIETCMKMLQQFNLENAHDKYPSQLSGGMKKRIALLRAFLTNSPLLLLDEPFAALDYFTKIEVQSLLLNLLETNKEKSLLLITHDINEAILLSDQIITLGGTPTHILKNTAIKFPRPRNIDMLLTDIGIQYRKHALCEDEFKPETC